MSSSDPPLSFLLSGDHKGKYPQQLVARFPHVARRLDELWNDPAGVGEYFSELMVSSRPNRQGFPPEVAAEIMSLCLAYDRIGQIKPMVEEQAHAATAAIDPWETERAQRELQRQGIDLSLAQIEEMLSRLEFQCRIEGETLYAQTPPHRLDIGSGQVLRLTDSPAIDGLPTVSPDGRWVGFVSNRDGAWKIWYVPIDGGAAAPLVTINGDLGNWIEQGIQWVD